MANEDLLPDLVNADISNINPRDAIAAAMIDRSAFAPQMTPDMRARLQTIVQGEVGHGASPEQQQIQLETAFNRAAARGQTLDQVTQQYTGPGSAGYYPASTFAGGRIRNPAEYDRFQRTVVDPVLAGSDVGTQRLGFAPTGNASGTVAANQFARGTRGGRVPGGSEAYFAEGSPQQLARLETFRRQGGGSFNVPTGAPTLTANDLSQDPAFAPQVPSVQVAQAGPQTLSDAVAEASDAGNPVIPTEIPKAPLTPNQRVAGGFDAMGIAPTGAPTAPAPVAQQPQGYALKPSDLPYPPFEYVESAPLGPKPEQPKPLPPSDAMNYAARYMDNPDVSEGTRAYFKHLYTVEDSYRKELETRATTAYTNDLAQWNKQSDEIEKRRVSKPADVVKLQSDLTTLEKTRQEIAQNTNAFDQIAGPDNTVLIRLKGAPPNTPFKPAPGTLDMNAVGNIRPSESQARLIDLAGKAAVAGRQAAGSNFSALAGLKDNLEGNYIPIGGNYLVSNEFRSQLGAANAWVNANIRKESGAAIGIQELYKDYSRYFPIPGDKQQQILEKADRRRGVEELNRDILGNAAPILDNFVDKLDRQGEAEEFAKPPIRLRSDHDPIFNDLPAGRRFITPDGQTLKKDFTPRLKPRETVQ